jgi:hypothetical protein
MLASHYMPLLFENGTASAFLQDGISPISANKCKFRFRLLFIIPRLMGGIPNLVILDAHNLFTDINLWETVGYY